MTTAKLFPSESLLDDARAAKSRGEKVQAEALFKKAIEERTKAVGAGDGSIGAYTHELGACQLSHGDYAAAEETLKKALELTEKAYYAVHFALAPILDDLSDLYLRQDKFADAEPILLRQLDIVDKTCSGDHRLTFETMHKLAYVQRKTGKAADAEKILLKALKTIDTPLGPIEEFRLDLAILYEEMGKTAEAETNFKQAVTGFEQRKNYRRMADAVLAFGSFLKKNGKQAQAKKAEELGAQIREGHGSDPTGDIFSATLLRA